MWLTSRGTAMRSKRQQGGRPGGAVVRVQAPQAAAQQQATHMLLHVGAQDGHSLAHAGLGFCGVLQQLAQVPAGLGGGAVGSLRGCGAQAGSAALAAGQPLRGRRCRVQGRGKMVRQGGPSASRPSKYSECSPSERHQVVRGVEFVSAGVPRGPHSRSVE